MVEPQQHRLGFDARDGHAKDVRGPLLRVAESFDAVDVGQTGGERLDLVRGSGPLGVERRAVCELLGDGAESYEPRHVLQAGSPRPFLVAADEQRVEPEPAADDERAGAHGRTELGSAQ